MLLPMATALRRWCQLVMKLMRARRFHGHCPFGFFSALPDSIVVEGWWDKYGWVKGFHIYNLSCPGSLVHLCPRMSLRLIQLLASLDIISSTNSSWRASTPSAGRSFMGPGPPPLTEEVQPRQCRLLGKWGNRFVMDLRG